MRDVLRQLAVEGYVDIREKRGARVVPMNHATQNWWANQFEALKACQERFRAAIAQNDAEKMVVENNRLLIDHWDLSRQNMELFIAPRALTLETTARAFAREAEASIGISDG